MIRDLDILLNSLVVLCWVERDKYVSKSWYLGYVNEVINVGDRFIVEHLHREKRGHDRVWRVPVKDDIVEVDVLQIMACGAQVHLGLFQLESSQTCTG